MLVEENKGTVTDDAAAKAPADTGVPAQSQAQEADRQQAVEPNWEEIEEKVSRGEYKPTFEEGQKHQEWVAAGRPKKGAEAKTEGVAQDPQQQAEQPTDDDINLAAKNPLSFTDEEANRIAGVMKKFGVDSLAELPDAVKRFEDRENARKGELGREVKSLREELDQIKQGGRDAGMPMGDLRLLMADFAAGKPEAIEWAKANLGLDVGASRTPAAAAAPSADDFAIPEQPPEDVVDEATWRHTTGLMKKMQEHYKARESDLRKTVDELRQQSENGRRLAQEAAEIRKQEQLRAQFHQQTLKAIESFPEDYKPKSGDLGRMLDDMYEGRAVDPRLQPLQELLSFAVQNGIRDLQTAHYARVGPQLRQTLAQREAPAEMRGRQSVLTQPTSVGLAGKRAESGEGAYQLVTPERFAAIVDGREPPPADWWSADGTRLDPKKVPAQYHAQVWPGGVPRNV